MNCLKCDTPLKPGAKFCTRCGEPVQNIEEKSSNICPNCKKPLKEGAKFCTSCGTQIMAAETVEKAPAVSSALSDNLDMVNQHIIWNVQQGELAYNITEKELAGYADARGIIIGEGTTALVRANGKRVAEVTGGIYDFVVAKKEAVREGRKSNTNDTEEANDTKQGALSFLVNMFSGKKRQTTTASEPNLMSPEEEALQTIREKAKDKAIFSIAIKQDKSFQLIFGAAPENEDACADFTPMRIKTKFVDVELGLRAAFRIDDFDAFAAQFLVSDKAASIASLTKYLNQTVRTAVQEVLYDVEILESRPDDIILQRLQTTLAQQIKGIGIVLEKVIEVTTSNKDLERFKALSREMYLSEKELDYLKRTNEFKNRLAVATNEQELTERSMDVDYRKRLNAINQDQLLGQDEYDKFVMLLESEQKIRKAKNEDEVNAALLDIERTGLIRQEDLNVLRHEIATKDYQRGAALRMMQRKDEIEYERMNKQSEIEMRSMEDQYADQRFNVALEQDNKKKLQELELAKQAQQAQQEANQRASELQMQRMRQMMEMDEEENEHAHRREVENKKMDQAHEASMDDKEKQYQIDKMKASAGRSAEEMMALSLGEMQDAESRKAVADAIAARGNAAREKEMADENEKKNSDYLDRMERMMDKMMDSNARIANGKSETEKENAAPQSTAPASKTGFTVYIEGFNSVLFSFEQVCGMIQNGVIKADTLLSSSNSPVPQPIRLIPDFKNFFPSANTLQCPVCGEAVNANMAFCDKCGTKLN